MAEKATLTVKAGTSGAVNAAFREVKLNGGKWQVAMVTEKDGYSIVSLEPIWKETGKHASGAPLFSADQTKEGILPGKTYEYAVYADETKLGTGQFTTAQLEGTKIPYGDMNTWSQYVGYSASSQIAVSYPNPDADNAFWSNGNNNMTQELCTPLAEADNQYAHMKGKEAFTVFAAGNLFTGAFEMDGIAGYARFGQKYTFTIHPSAVKLRYKAKIGKINAVNPNKEMVLPDHMKEGQIDPARVFVCITNWTDRHSVHSGLGVKLDEINGFDPETDAKTAEGEILAYARLTITESAGEWTEVTIPLLYLNKFAKPAENNYSLVVSCASSAYGDYLCGSTDNELDIDYIEWVY